MTSRLSVETLYRRCQAELINFLIRRFGREVHAEDIVHDAFHNLLKVENLEGIEDKRAYIFKAAHHLALNRVRQSHRHQNFVSTITASADDEDVNPIADLQENIELIQTALNALPDKTRLIFEQNRFHGASYQDIAETTGLSVSAVEKHMMKALKVLRAAFADANEGGVRP